MPVLLIGLLASAVLTYQFSQAIEADDRRRFESAARVVEDAIVHRLETYVALLKGGVGLFAASDVVTRADFHAYVERLQLRSSYPGVQGLGFTRHLLPGEVASFVEEQRASGLADFSVWPSIPRSDYHSIVYLEPDDRRNRAAVGYDMFTEPVRRAAMARARDTGGASASGAVTLVQEIDDDRQAGFLIYVPVYDKDETPPTVEERRARLFGFVYAAFRGNDLVQRTVDARNTPLVDFEIIDGSAGDPAVRLAASGPATAAPWFESTRRVDAWSRPWTLVFRSSAHLEATSRRPLVPVAFASGVIASLTLFALAWFGMRARRTAEQLVTYQEAVRSGERLHQLAVGQVLEYAIFTVDDRGRMASWNEGVGRVLGWSASEFVGQPFSVIVPPDDDAALTSSVHDSLPDAGVSSREGVFVARDGRRFWASITRMALTDDAGHPVGFMAVMRDISRRRSAEDAIARLNLDLQQQVRDFETLIDVLPIGIAVALDRECRTIRVNPALLRLLNRRARTGVTLRAPLQARGRVRAYVDSVETPLEQLPLHVAAREGRALHEVEIDLVVGDGPRTRLLVFASPLLDVHGDPRGSVAAFVDLTERSAAEARFRMLADSAPVLVWTTDVAFACTWVNRAWIEFTGRKVEDALGDGWLACVHPDDAESWREATRFAVDARIPFSLEYRLRRHDGEWRWMADQGRPLQGGPGGAFSGYIGSCIDITERRQATAVLAASEERFRQLANTIPQLAWMAGADGKVVWYNQRWYEYTGFEPGRPANLDPRQLTRDGDEFRRVQDGFRRAVASGEPWEDTFPLRRHDGEYRWHLSRALPLRDTDGRVVAWFGTNTDVTEERLLAEQRNQLFEAERAARAEVERIGRMKDEFLATLSHELRTPLNAILGWAQILARTTGPGAEARRGLDTIDRNARAQAKIIEDLLDMNRIVSGRIRLDLQPVDIAGVAEAALDVVGPTAEAKGVGLRRNFPANLGVASVDPNRLQQILWNLLANAIKFTPTGGEVRLTLSSDHSSVVFAVSDTGEGISPDFLPHVFERFRQADASTTRHHSGLGIGLSIVKGLVELHGGTIEAFSSGEHQGATFVVTLPASWQPPPHPIPAAEPFRAAAAPALKDLSILVVDDDRDARELVRTILEEEGARVMLASTGRQALTLLDGNGRCDLILSDIGMRDLDGYELIQQVQARQSPGTMIPAVAVTAYARVEDRERALGAGYHAHVSKPIDRRQLLDVMSGLIAARSSRG